ncbi:Cobalt-zinc-cadmium resistance protein CzcA [Methylacidimicrobium cyclopophantes]|uniref:Cobalt-zinc-cadmium resistance protein CzcA n=1 Tax=Methylacidimicrobium cyclopophantes TaxID=1041766 RepID=A0A5E6MB85_9BACT|nr:CusA/CzcA family heavy metal efflux RND transporter [Methylacidimicrobium cyclopophantes]VVM06439.1 Cobalt-zinc-cadmium resistance protein CzcA [Methylacidimicrobium cyclopophantes]
MINALLRFAVHRRELIFFASAAIFGLGLWAALRLPIDAVPDITSPMVQVNTAVPSLAPEEIEKLVTFPLEVELAGIPGLDVMRSLSKFGLSQVTLIFRDGTDIYRSRQLVSERLLAAEAKLPRGLSPSLAPMATGLGEILYYSLEYRPDAEDKPPTEILQLMELRLLQEYSVKPLLRMVPGVADINTSGGYEKLIVVSPTAESLFHAGLTASELGALVGKNVQNAGGAVIDEMGQQLFVRSLGRVESLEQIEQLPIKYAGGTQPLLVRNLAQVAVGPNIRTGAATVNGKEAVVGTVLMLIGENARAVASRVKEKMAEIRKRLPASVEIRILYDQSELVSRTIQTVVKNLTEGALLVVGVLFLLVGDVRASLLVTSVIPLSFLFALLSMGPLHISANLMSLGAIDFGLLVDGAVVLVDNALRELAQRRSRVGHPLSPSERLSTILFAAEQVGPSVFFGVLVITVVYVPILSLGGIEGKMFRPMAFSVILALSGSLLLALTYVPAAATVWIRGNGSDRETWMVRIARKAYLPLLRWTLGRGGILVVGGSFAAFAFALWTLRHMGAVFVPRLDEGAFTIEFYKAPSVSLEASVAIEKATEKMLLERIPEAEVLFSRTGTSEIATDPMPPNENDLYMMLRPRSQWRRENGRPIDRERLIEIISREVETRVPGQSMLFVQPIEMRFNDMLEGQRAELAVKWFGPDYDILEGLASRTQEILRTIPGALEVEFQSAGRCPSLEFRPDRVAMERYIVESVEINNAIATGIGGETVGTMIDGERRYPLVIRLPEAERSDPKKVLELPVRSENGGLLPLKEVAGYTIRNRVRMIHRGSGIRYQVLEVTLGSRDLEGFVREARTRILRALHPPPGYFLEFGGQYQNLVHAQARLAVIIPAGLLLIFFLLYTALGSLRQTLLVLLSVPVAATGGIFSLRILNLPFSLSAAVGFIALSGIATLASLVLISFFNQLRNDGKSVRESVWEGCQIRLRPVLMTAAVASLGFLPMALAQGAGAEVQRPLALVVIGGILSSSLLSLLLLPALYTWTERDDARHRSSMQPKSTAEQNPLAAESPHAAAADDPS